MGRGKRFAQPGGDAPAPATPAGDNGAEILAPDVAALLEEFGTGVTVMLFRREDALGEEAYLSSLPLTGFDLDRLAERFGGGRYRMQLKDGSRKYIKGSTRVFVIAGPSKYPAAAPAPAASGPLGAAPTALESRLERLELLLTRPPADPLETAIKLMGMFKEQMIPHTQTPASEMAAAFREGMSLTREMMAQQGGGGDDDRGYSLVLETVGRPLARALERQFEREDAKRIAPPAPALPAPRSQPPAAPAPTEGEPVGIAWYLKLKSYIPKLLELAAADRDTYGWARVILEELDDDTAANLRTALADPGLLDTLAHVVPEVNTYRDWFTRFLADAAEVLNDEIEDDDGGDGAHDSALGVEDDPESVGLERAARDARERERQTRDTSGD